MNSLSALSGCASARGAFVLGLLLAALAADAAQRTWDGGGNDGNWRTAQNWDGSIFLPISIAAGDTLVFPEGPTKLVNTNDFGAGTNFNSLTFSGDDYIVRGSTIGLTNGISLTHASGATSLYLPITLRDAQSFTVSSASAFLHLYGDVAIGLNTLTFDGAGNSVLLGEITNGRIGFGVRNTVRKSGTGRLIIFQPTDHDVPTIVNGGILAVEHRMTNSAVTVNAGGTLRGSGKIAALTGNGGLIQPGGTTPDSLECFGDVTLPAGTTLRLRLNGTTTGVTHDQLEVHGVVTLGGMLDISLGYLPAVGDRFTIIDNDGTDEVIGTFAGLPEGAEFTLNGRPFKVSYGQRVGGFGRDVNDVTIEAIPALAIWDGEGGLNNRWSEPINWVGDTIPFPGDHVRFTNSTFLTTTNDFPHGRLFGSFLFGTGNHTLKGNTAALDGTLTVPASAVINVEMPLSLNRGFTLTEPCGVRLKSVILRNNATFAPGPGLLSLTNITPAGYKLTLEVESGRTLQIYGTVEASGTLSKVGPGELTISGVNNSQTVVSEGLLRILRNGFNAGHLQIQSGASAFAEGNLNTLEVLSGGSFRPSYRIEGNNGVQPTAFSTVHLEAGSFFDVDILRAFVDGTNRIVSSSLTVGSAGYNSNTVELSGANLRVNVEPNVVPDRDFTIIGFASYNYNPVIGTFAGLPGGAAFTAAGQVLGLTYRAGLNSDEVMIFPNPELVWTGAAGNGFWSTPGNWSAEIAPLPGARLVFPASAARYNTTNDFTNTLAVSSLRFESGLYSVAGNRLNVADGIFCSYTSGQVVFSGELTTPGFIGSGDVLSIRVTTNTAGLNFNGRIFGGNTWRKIGPGRLRIGGTEPNSPDLLRVAEGLVELAKVGNNAVGRWLSIGDGAPGAILRILADNQIPSSTPVDISDGCLFDLNGHTEKIRALGIVAGRGEIRLGTLFNQGSLTVSTGNYSGAITGFGTFGKTGHEMLILTGTNTFGGNTIISEGTLQVDGIQTTSIIRMDGGRLQGRGRVGSVQSSTSGVVAPGWGGAEFHNYLYCGSVTFNSTTAFEPMLTEVAPGFEAHKLDATGSVSLGASSLNLRILGNFIPPTNKTFVIIENDGADPVLGGFASLPESAVFAAGGFAFRISYVGGTGNDVTVTRVSASPSNLSSIQSLGNGRVLIQGAGFEGLRYDIQSASNLNPVISWVQVGRATGDSSGVFQFIHSNAPSVDKRFYRAVSP